jgi:hypothetical protein
MVNPDVEPGGRELWFMDKLASYTVRTMNANADALHCIAAAMLRDRLRLGARTKQ